MYTRQGQGTVLYTKQGQGTISCTQDKVRVLYNVQHTMSTDYILYNRQGQVNISCTRNRAGRCYCLYETGSGDYIDVYTRQAQGPVWCTLDMSSTYVHETGPCT